MQFQPGVIGKAVRDAELNRDSRLSAAARVQGNRTHPSADRIKDLTAHDLRRTAASRMTGMYRSAHGFQDPDHVEPGVTAVYDPHSYDCEKREVLEQWALRLRVIVSGLREVTAEELAQPENIRSGRP